MSKLKKRVSFHTLGCRLNQSETEVLVRKFEQQGYLVVPETQSADVCVVNTCTVTEHSDSKNRQAIRMLHRQSPNAKIAVIGCYAQMEPETIANIDGVSMVIGSEEKLRVIEYLEQVGQSETPLIVRPKMKNESFLAPVVPLSLKTHEKLFKKNDCDTIQSLDSLGLEIQNTRASLKIQDGCDFMCSFCIIPFARGRSRYRSFDNLLEEARMRVAEGVQEIVLTGVNVGTYAEDHKSFIDVVDELNSLEDLVRIRISSIEPTTVSEILFQYMADSSHKLVPFFHLPLQSGADSILQKMKRRHSVQQYSEEVQRAYEGVPDLCLGTDVMVGFPGESETDFQETYDLLTNLPISYFHVFPFSAREGTPAFKMEGQVNPALKQERAALLRELSQKKRFAFQQKYLGKIKDILWETRKPDGVVSGYTDNFIRVVLDEKEQTMQKDYKNKILATRLDSIKGQTMFGSLVS